MRGLRSELKLLEDSDFGITSKKEIMSIMADFNGKRNNKNSKKNNRPTNKVKNFGDKKETRIAAPESCGGLIEYKMGKTMAEEILKADKSKKAPQEVLCEYVNTQMGLMGYCVKVHVN